MCTGDNVLTARSIALQCNIYTAGGIIMEGPHFRMLPPDVMKSIAPRLQVLARSSPEDKRILVEMLKDRGDIIGVTGDGTNDGPALKTAHIGFSMGVTGTEVAKEASDIILMDDNFSSIVSAIMWGRCVNDAVRKFLQFQINTNITAVLITFITALAARSEQSALGAVQLLWINLIMDTFAALALATDPASEALLDRKPDKKTDPLFTVNMIKQIVGQSTYLIIIILIFHFLGLKILGLHFDNSTEQKHQNTVVQTLVFNAFVFAQIWNSFNSRRLDRKLNVFEGVLENWYFIAITSIGSSLFPETASLLISLYRGFCPNPYMPCRWSSLSGHPHGWERMGHLHGSWFRCTPTWRSHPSHPQRALRAYLCDATATTQTGGAAYDASRRRAWLCVCHGPRA
jgi:Ca2+-transporting ATPase